MAAAGGDCVDDVGLGATVVEMREAMVEMIWAGARQVLETAWGGGARQISGV